MVSNSVGFKLGEVRLKMGQKWCRTPTTSVPRDPLNRGFDQILNKVLTNFWVRPAEKLFLMRLPTTLSQVKPKNFPYFVQYWSKTGLIPSLSVEELLLMTRLLYI